MMGNQASTPDGGRSDDRLVKVFFRVVEQVLAYPDSGAAAASAARLLELLEEAWAIVSSITDRDIMEKLSPSDAESDGAEIAHALISILENAEDESRGEEEAARAGTEADAELEEARPRLYRPGSEIKLAHAPDIIHAHIFWDPACRPLGKFRSTMSDVFIMALAAGLTKGRATLYNAPNGPSTGLHGRIKSPGLLRGCSTTCAEDMIAHWLREVSEGAQTEKSLKQ